MSASLVPGVPSPDEVEARLARWAARDAIVGLDAENDELRRRLADRDAEIAALRARLDQMGQRIAQMAVEIDGLRAQVGAARREPVWRTALRPGVRLGRAVFRRLGGRKG